MTPLQVAHMNVSSHPGQPDGMRMAELLALQAGEPLSGALMASGATPWPLQGNPCKEPSWPQVRHPGHFGRSAILQFFYYSFLCYTQEMRGFTTGSSID